MAMGESEAKKRWQKENTVFIGIKLQKSTDKDLIAFLNASVDPEKKIGTQTIIKRALLEYMANHGEENNR